ncbi:MFS transporter (plasmid) [Vibrio nigripulchritudo]|uniref:MFS transporter n=1 Tax=Vibrio nigripulchritudo TaxID=28173 RepID=UPI001C798FA4|nr:MFS transporter [Vibrio nigripulchritudo]BCL73905.1 MFS transporter [Vibrio nigripulchritudo]BDU35281.1 MFS transporter [Vibrio nigripulchritudo]
MIPTENDEITVENNKLNTNLHATKMWTFIWLWAGFILVALNLRLIFASLGPLLHNLELGVSTTLLVTTLPVALLGIFSLAGVHLRRRFGEERALFLALTLLTLGCGVRWLGEGALILGTVIGSTGIAVMNVIMPALARKRFEPQHIGMVMGIYALMLGVGAVLGAASSFPLFQWLGADTEAAYRSLGLWTIPALLALFIWIPQLEHKIDPHTQTCASSAVSINVYRSITAWSITLFFGLQALNLYVFLPWMPTILMDRGISQASASFIFSLSQISLMLGSFVTPLLAARKPDQRLWIIMTVLTCLAGTLGLAYAPSNSVIAWALLLGFGQGAGPSLGAFLFVAKASNIETATRISAMAQTLGYLIAAAGPLLVGAIYHLTETWNVPILILVAILVVELIVSLPAGRNIKV